MVVISEMYRRNNDFSRLTAFSISDVKYAYLNLTASKQQMAYES